MGYFMPYRYAAEVPNSGSRYEWVEERFRGGALPHMMATLTEIESYREALLAIGSSPPPEPRWAQDWFPALDAAAAYVFVRTRRPARILEIGSGHSTRFLARAVRDGGLATEITCIDPAPRADLSGTGVRFLNQTIQQTAMADLPELGPGDILFLDSSHLVLPGSDVDLVLNHLLPTLPAGLLVHIHDIVLPDPYPEAWAWRTYNEQQLVAALLSGGGFEALFSSHFARSRLLGKADCPDLGWLPLPDGALETSLWLEKR
ncbi:class I SAM-dependent methyltransferase [Nisaea acidiphila]|uniref:Class I SAM-dependent methyltransferase n=1 Tax=Nisaea acidiphila TaxID=1862145 RepID=A0A9J7ALX5_9PROT|nr:class I SAM-dependent methyltransferase [Nisaea acidiphila]UUX47962.1 class I SAM-dependent methyltransferase [Nisaea acidiphila]